MLNTGKVTVLVSGGVDSTACIAFYLQSRCQVEAVFVDYGQKAVAQEKIAAARICDHYQVPLRQLTHSSGKVVEDGFIVGRNSFLLCSVLMSLPTPHGIVATRAKGYGTYYTKQKPLNAAALKDAEGYRSESPR